MLGSSLSGLSVVFRMPASLMYLTTQKYLALIVQRVSQKGKGLVFNQNKNQFNKTFVFGKINSKSLVCLVFAGLCFFRLHSQVCVLDPGSGGINSGLGIWGRNSLLVSGHLPQLT